MRKTNKYNVLVILLLIAATLSSCKKKDEPFMATGTIIGGYDCAFASVFVEVDEEYPIGKALGEVGEGVLYPLFIVPGTYHNVIQVQWYENIPDIHNWREDLSSNPRISFSYRVADERGDDFLLFLGRTSICLLIYSGPPQTPIFVITKCQILK